MNFPCFRAVRCHEYVNMVGYSVKMFVMPCQFAFVAWCEVRAGWQVL